MMSLRKIILTGALMLTMGLLGCATVTQLGTQMGQEAGVISQEQGDSIRRVSEAAQKSFTDLTPEQEYYIGRSVAASIFQSYPPLDNPEANAYLNTLGQTLAMASDRPETFGGYHFLLLDTDEINAFAAPGGLIMVSRGLVACCPDEDALAAVLAHEIGHVQNKDGLRAIKSSRWTSLAAVGLEEGFSNLGNEDMKKVAQQFSGCIDDIAQTLVVNGYARGQESEADATAITILKRVGYNARSLDEMLGEMDKRLESGGPGFARTHPSPKDRQEDVRPLLKGSKTAPVPAARQSRFERALGRI